MDLFLNWSLWLPCLLYSYEGRFFGIILVASLHLAIPLTDSLALLIVSNSCQNNEKQKFLRYTQKSPFHAMKGNMHQVILSNWIMANPELFRENASHMHPNLLKDIGESYLILSIWTYFSIKEFSIEQGDKMLPAVDRSKLEIHIPYVCTISERFWKLSQAQILSLQCAPVESMKCTIWSCAFCLLPSKLWNWGAMYPIGLGLVVQSDTMALDLSRSVI